VNPDSAVFGRRFRFSFLGYWNPYMFEFIAPLFLALQKATGLNFSPFYNEYDFSRLMTGVQTSLLLIVCVLIVSLIVGLLGAAAQRSQFRVLRFLVAAYIAMFRNTPPVVQLLFFYFGLGALTPQVDMGGWYEPMISSFGWAVIALGIFGGSYNVEIFRAGIEAVPETTLEASEALAFSPVQTFIHVTMPLALRFSLPALASNLISLAKTTSIAYVIAVPEMTYALSGVWNDSLNVGEMMTLLFIYYISVVAVIGAIMGRLEKRLAVPGLGK
tara:strand:- start:8251 stop:9066 length:816 start_codon:yes stop_codon:yes gene_type:complete